MPRDNGEALTRTPPQEGARLLLHVCCGPCAVMPILRCREEGFLVTAWFMNPNIQPLTEYLRRREAAQQACAELNVELLCADEEWDIAVWLRKAAGRDAKPARCAFCCENRINAAFVKAGELGMPFFSSSLLYSRHQPHKVIATAGLRLTWKNPGGPVFLYRDFREEWQAGIERSRELGLYRQSYCGCVYSEAERHAGRLAKLMYRDAG
ncbi:MAG: epoxyqueuosine reductase QueH [Desulfovibrio sp.]|nr:epoxyqueuosine reductase QueH [Desulfovibrio sp.]